MERLAAALKLIERDDSDLQRAQRLKAWSELFDTMDVAIDYIERFERKTMLTHVVFFWLKPNLTPNERARFETGIKSLTTRTEGAPAP